MDEQVIAELDDLARALDADGDRDLEYWRSHYHAAMLNWNVALATIDELRAENERMKANQIPLGWVCHP